MVRGRWARVIGWVGLVWLVLARVKWFGLATQVRFGFLGLNPKLLSLGSSQFSIIQFFSLIFCTLSIIFSEFFSLKVEFPSESLLKVHSRKFPSITHQRHLGVASIDT